MVAHTVSVPMGEWRWCLRSGAKRKKRNKRKTNEAEAAVYRGAMPPLRRSLSIVDGSIIRSHSLTLTRLDRWLTSSKPGSASSPTSRYDSTRLTVVRVHLPRTDVPCVQRVLGEYVDGRRTLPNLRASLLPLLDASLALADASHSDAAAAAATPEAATNARKTAIADFRSTIEFASRRLLESIIVPTLCLP